MNTGGHGRSELFRETLLNGSVVLLLGSFIIGLVAGQRRLSAHRAGLRDGVPRRALPLPARHGAGGRKAPDGIALADLQARGARRGSLRSSTVPSGYWSRQPSALGRGYGRRFSAFWRPGASYIAVPAAMRMALPEADAGLYLSMSLGVTFPFNIVAGIPLYTAAGAYGSSRHDHHHLQDQE